MPKKVAIVGSGASALGYIVGMIDGLKKTQAPFDLQVDIFEKAADIGLGLPYDATKTAPEHLLNVQAVSSMAVDVMHPQDMGAMETRERRSFLRWMNAEENQEVVDRKLQEVFVARFKRKFLAEFDAEFDEKLFEGKNIFDKKFKNTTGYTYYAEWLGADFERMCDDYPQHCRDLKERYISSVQNSETAFFPRIIYGIYLQELFHKAKDDLAKIIGADKIKIHANADVFYLDKDGKIKYQQDGQTHEEQFDNVGVGTGRWQEEPQPAGQSSKIVKKIWPISNVEQALLNAIAVAKALGKTEVRMAIKGSSVSAVDIIKTVFFDGKFEKDENGKEVFIAKDSGVKVVVDMVSRNGFLPKIRSGNLKYVGRDSLEHYPNALWAVAKDYGFDLGEMPKDINWDGMKKAEGKLRNHIEQQQGKFDLRQQLKLFGELLAKSYENIGSPKALAIKGFVGFIADERNNYQEILQGFLALREQNPIDELRKDLAASKEKDYIWEHVFEIFDFATSKFPPEERLFWNEHQSVMLPYDTAMPAKSAEDLILYHEAGVFNVVACGHKAVKDEAVVDGVNVDCGRYGTRKYDLVVDASGPKLNLQTTQSPIYQSFYESLSAEEKAKVDGEMKMQSHVFPDKDGCPKIIFFRNNSGVGAASRATKDMGIKVIDHFTTKVSVPDAETTVAPRLQGPLAAADVKGKSAS